jgi:hypothetical protein
MKYSLMFRHREPGRVPEERCQDQPIVLEGEFALIPDVGDEVTCQFEGRATTFKVLSRHFTYVDRSCAVDIQVSQPSTEPKPLGLKE